MEQDASQEKDAVKQYDLTVAFHACSVPSGPTSLAKPPGPPAASIAWACTQETQFWRGRPRGRLPGQTLGRTDPGWNNSCLSNALSPILAIFPNCTNCRHKSVFDIAWLRAANRTSLLGTLE